MKLSFDILVVAWLWLLLFAHLLGFCALLLALLLALLPTEAEAGTILDQLWSILHM